VILFKDASANKGGVTSSSCEVLAALALTDEEHDSLMCSREPAPNSPATPPPEFYQKYAVNVQEKIELNARREFDCLMKERQRTGLALSIIGDRVSEKINELAASIRSSPLLWNDVKLRSVVLANAVPPLLLTKVGGVETLLARVPLAYSQWIFACSLASDYVYSCGLDTTEFTFMMYISNLRANISA
jgi:glutamate dehydrogenase